MLKILSILWNSFRMALQELKVNKLRTFLSLFGITIGIFCIIGVLATVDSLERKKLSMMRALLIAADHIGSARMEQSIPSYKEIKLIDFTPKREGVYFPLRMFQEGLLTITTDVILHAPTGSGKTEAALSWVFANQKENAHLFYLLPYTASINAMVGRLQSVFGIDKVTALHSKTLDFSSFESSLANCS